METEKVDNDQSQIGDRVSIAFEKNLNAHGHAYQNAITRKFKQMRGSETLWDIEGTEIPVTSGGINTHIDLVCSILYDYQGQDNRFFLVAECKRADPATAIWCFAKVPITWGDHYGAYIQFDKFFKRPNEAAYNSGTGLATTERPIMGLGMEVKTEKRGDGVGSSERSAINSAVTQVLRGVSGYINYLSTGGRATRKLDLDHSHIVVPVIFTTAQIYITDANIASADLATGELPKGTVQTEKTDWIWYNYNRSFQLANDLSLTGDLKSNYSYYFREFTRTVAIVGPDGIDSFLRYNFKYASF